MERLPREVKEQILQLVLQDTYIGCAGFIANVSREWQTIVEPVTFKSLHLTQERLEEALAKGTFTPARQAYVESIELTVKLPRYSQYEHLTSAKERNNKSFSKAVVDLLGLLSTWPSQSHGLKLSLLLDFIPCKPYKQVHCPECALQGYDTKSSTKFLYEFVGLRDDVCHQLPEVPCVTEFAAGPVNLCNMSIIPKSCCMIASRFPNLQGIHWELRDGYQNHFFQTNLRRNFAIGISLLPRSVRKLSLTYDDHGQGVESSICPLGTRDPLSAALRNFSKQLECLSLTMIAGTELFCDPDGGCDEDCWPLLREVKVALALRTPWGEPIFNFDIYNPNVDLNDAETYRIIPLDERVNPYCLAFARAAAHMPKLKTMSVQWRTKTKSGMEYTIDPDSSGAQFLSKSSPGLNITNEIQEAWWKAALVHVREGAQFHFVVMDDEERFKHRNRWPYNFGSRLPVHEPEPYNLIEWTRSEV